MFRTYRSNPLVQHVLLNRIAHNIPHNSILIRTFLDFRYGAKLAQFELRGCFIFGFPCRSSVPSWTTTVERCLVLGWWSLRSAGSLLMISLFTAPTYKIA